MVKSLKSPQKKQLYLLKIKPLVSAITTISYLILKNQYTLKVFLEISYNTYSKFLRKRHVVN